MEVHHHRADIVRRPTVMVDDADLGDGLKQRLTLHLIRPVGIHHDQNASVIRHQQGILAGDKNIPVLGHRLNFGDQLGSRVLFQVDDDAALFAPLPAQTAHAHGRAHRVQVGVLVAHDEHMAALTDELHQGIGGDPGAHLAPVIRLPLPSAIEAEIEPILDDRLVAAPAQSHFDAQGREIIALVKAGSVHAQADGKGGGQAGGVGNLMDGFQQGKLIVHRPLQIPLFKNKQEPVTLQLAEQTAVALCPLGNGLVQPGVHGGNGAFRQVLGQLLVVIDQNNGYHRPGADIFVPDLVQLRQIAEIQSPQHGTPVVLRPDGGAVDPIAPVAQGRIPRAFGFAGFQPVQREVRQHLLQLLLHHGVGIARQLAEPVVGPDNDPVPQPDKHRGQGALPLGGSLQGVGNRLDIPLDLPIPAIPVHDVEHEHHQRHRRLRRRQPEVPLQQGCRAESRHHHKIHSHSGTQKLSKLSVHCAASFFSSNR